jgi:hypothetical protein
MAGADATTADKALKEFYEPALVEELNQENILLNHVETTDQDIEGREVVLSLHISRNSGVGARKSGDNLPSAGSQGYVDERVKTKRNYGRIQIDGELIRSMKSDRGSFARAVDSESRGVVDDLKRDVNRQLWGTADGVIATTGTTTTANLVVLAASTPLSVMRFFEVGMVIDIGVVATPTSIASSRMITAIDIDNKTITIDGATVSTVNNTSKIFRAGAGGATTNQREVTGLQAIVDSTGTLFNVNPSTYPVWASYEDSTGGNATELKFQKAMDRVRTNSGQDITMILTTDGVYRNYFAQLQASKRYANTQTLNGGFEALTVNSGRGPVPLSWDRDCPDGVAIGLSLKNLKQYQKSDWEFMQEDGAILSRVASQDAYEATLFKFHELATNRRNAFFKLSGITES